MLGYAKGVEKGVHLFLISKVPDNKFHGANMGPIWGRQDSGGPHVGTIHFAIWSLLLNTQLAECLI